MPQTNRPLGAERAGSAAPFVSRAGAPSAMDHPELARRLTLSLAGRARSVAPSARAARLPAEGARDHPRRWGRHRALQHRPLGATSCDAGRGLRPSGGAARGGRAGRRPRRCAPSRLRARRHVPDPPRRRTWSSCRTSSTDWDAPDCERLVRRCADSLPPGGRLVIRRLPARRLTARFRSPSTRPRSSRRTEGRAYSGAEHAAWLAAAELSVEGPHADARPLEPAGRAARAGVTRPAPRPRAGAGAYQEVAGGSSGGPRRAASARADPSIRISAEPGSISIRGFAWL